VAALQPPRPRETRMDHIEIVVTAWMTAAVTDPENHRPVRSR